MVKFQDQCLLKLQTISEYFVEVWPECCSICAPFQLTKLESSVQRIPGTGLVVALSVSWRHINRVELLLWGSHLLPGNFKCQCRKNSLFIVENLNINYIDIYKHIFNEKYDRYEEKQRCFLNSYFFLSHIMVLAIRQKLQKLWVFLLTTGLELERDRAKSPTPKLAL